MKREISEAAAENQSEKWRAKRKTSGGIGAARRRWAAWRKTGENRKISEEQRSIEEKNESMRRKLKRQ